LHTDRAELTPAFFFVAFVPFVVFFRHA